MGHSHVGDRYKSMNLIFHIVCYMGYYMNIIEKVIRYDTSVTLDTYYNQLLIMLVGVKPPCVLFLRVISLHTLSIIFGR